MSNNLAAKLAGDAEDNFVTDEERWPSLAYLVHVRDKSTCTASIIGPRWVVASHSCITKSDSDPLNWAVVGGPAGVTNTDRTQIKVVNRIVSHPMAGKNRGFYHSDLALVQLTTSFEFDSFIQPICVSDSQPQIGDLCVVAGWTENPSVQGMLIK